MTTQKTLILGVLLLSSVFLVGCSSSSTVSQNTSGKTQEQLVFSAENSVGKLQDYPLQQAFDKSKAGTPLKQAVENFETDPGEWKSSPSEQPNSFVVEYVSTDEGFRPKWMVSEVEIIALNGSAKSVTPELETKVTIQGTDEEKTIYADLKVLLDKRMQELYAEQILDTKKEDQVFLQTVSEIATKYGKTSKEVSDLYSRMEQESMKKALDKNSDL